MPPAADHSYRKEALQITVKGVTGDARLGGQGLQAPGGLVQFGDQLRSAQGEELMQGGGPVAEVEPLEGLCRRRFCQDGLAPAPLHQPYLHQMSYEPGHRLSLQTKLFTERAGIYRLFGSGDEGQRANVVFAEGHLFELDQIHI